MSFASGFMAGYIGTQIGKNITNNNDFEARMRLAQYEANNKREFNELLRECRQQQRLEQEKQEQVEKQIKLTMLLKYNIGDKIKIKPELIPGRDTYRIYCAKSLLNYVGKEATIININDKEFFYELDIDNGLGAWCDEMFEDYVPDSSIITIDLNEYDLDTKLKILGLILK